MGSLSGPDRSIAEQAAQWLVELEDAPPRTLQDFALWLQSSPRHIEEFLLAAAVWKELDRLDPARQIDVERLIAEAKRAVTPLALPAPARSDADMRQRRQTWAALISVAAVLVISIAAWVFRAGTPHEYATSRGEQRAFKLEDGSVLFLNTQSRVAVRYSRAARIVQLVEGEAMFTVEHDAARPFRVMAGPTVIQAVGTRFNVYRTATGTTVSVVEGVVRISPRTASTAPKSNATAAAGEQARVSPTGEVETRAVPDLAQLVAWRERRLIFRGDSLDEVATEFNRYNSLQIRVEGSTTKGKHITGVFNADDPRSFVQFLARDTDLVVAESGDEIVIRGR